MTLPSPTKVFAGSARNTSLNGDSPNAGPFVTVTTPVQPCMADSQENHNYFLRPAGSEKLALAKLGLLGPQQGTS